MNFLNRKKDQDICLLELTEDVIESGRHNNVLLRTICLPDKESIPGSKCFTSGINQAGFRINALNPVSDWLILEEPISLIDEILASSRLR